ncbi:MAG TPA: LLM class flavin-dependent oxidoreductase [Candidatus Binatia bacterium]|jgi:alkanesulfonate monooxygenase SsuD/methylene tetrahydromethanopterin reductase-like flavin-dependent oxidoreductase (luciferase family)
MDYGAHLPVIDFGFQRFSLEWLSTYVRTARDLGFKAISTNDHLIHSRPWLDAPTALASIISESGNMTLGTSIILSVVRGPMQLAKTMAAIDVLSNGRLIVGAGPGSSARDYEIVGLNYAERWKRFDESVQALRSLWTGVGFTGRFYSTEGVNLEPKPLQKPAPPIWIGSWGSDAGLRRVARLADGWLASAYNTLPDQFSIALDKLHTQLKTVGKDPVSFPNALVTMFMYVTENKSEAERLLSETLTAFLHRPLDQLRERLLVGPPEACAEKLAAYKKAGVQRVFVWPIKDEIEQLSQFQGKVVPLVN